LLTFAPKQTDMTIRSWIKQREIVGKPTFSIADVKEEFPNTSVRVIASELYRLSKQSIIVSVYKCFYTVIPVQYSARGVVPPLYYIDQLMSYLGKPYYISLLSAAELHGAAHQRPQKFSVTSILPKATTSSRYNNQLMWNYRREIPESLLMQRNSETGRVRFSSPELTAVDLVQYNQLIGGLSMAATVLEELLEYTDFNRQFESLLSVTNIPTLQRLGYISEVILEETDQANTLFGLLKSSNKRMKKIPLDSDHSTDGYPSDNRWNVIVNQTIEPDDL
jgi:predicted transcriptional regulator of viral defense system